MRKKKKNIILIVGIIIFVALLYNYTSLLSLYGAGYKVYANQVTVISENNEYIEYNIPFSILHGNLMGSCSTGTSFDVNFITYPSPSYFDAREYTGSEMMLPASSPPKNINIELNREFAGEVSNINANLVFNPCAGTTASVSIIPYVNTICKVKDYSDDKQNIECSINGYFNGISSSPLPGIPANTEITGNLKVTSFSGGTIKVKFLKEGIQCLDNSNCALNETCKNNLCVLDIPTPPPVTPFWSKILNTIIDWIKNIFDFFFSITGQTTVEPNTIQSYQINLLTSIPDSDYSDGTYQRDMSNWAMIDKNNNIIKEGTWEETFGDYSKNVTITVPSNPMNFAIIGLIYRYTMKYTPGIGWETISEEIIAKEGLNVATKIPAPDDTPIPGFQSLIKLISDFINWLINLFK